MIDLLVFAQEARRDFIAAGPERHFACPAGHATGTNGDSHCVMGHAILTTSRRLRPSEAPLFEFEAAWKNANDMAFPQDTNAMGFAACVAAYDRLVASLAPTPAPVERVEVLA